MPSTIVRARRKAPQRYKSPKILESTLQKQCVAWFRTQYRDKLIYATPNEAKRSFALASHCRAMGMTSGIPDLFIPFPVAHFHGLYIELKIHPNKPTDNQNAMMAHLVKQGYAVHLCYDFEAFQIIVKTYLNAGIPATKTLLDEITFLSNNKLVDN